ncbi:MAG: allophanate hydrolase subunit 1, partial [Firmicutes bacterium]|nr:allophanate hydrolase subunit 1 [Bacillota bacterium]
MRNLHHLLATHKLPGVRQTVPAYSSLLIYFNPLLLTHEQLILQITKLQQTAQTVSQPAAVLFHIPVLYGGEFGPDLSYVAAHTGLCEEEVIALHSAAKYRVYMLGFTPGFGYLGGLDPRLATPRLENPRLKIAAGSVGIAGEQTGV